jgi:hypothetical protein
MIHRYFKCPVVGTCLSLEEQKRLLTKTGHSIKNRSAHEIHGIFVHSLSDKNRLSMRIDAYLHRKFVQMLAGSGLSTISHALLESQKGASIQQNTERTRQSVMCSFATFSVALAVRDQRIYRQTLSDESNAKKVILNLEPFYGDDEVEYNNNSQPSFS